MSQDIEEYIRYGGVLDKLLVIRCINSLGHSPEPMFTNAGSFTDTDPMESSHGKPCTIEEPTAELYSKRGFSTIKKIFSGSGKKVIRYSCADENSLMHQLSPEAGTFTLMAGPPGIGKTTLVMQTIAETLCRNDDIGSILIANTDQNVENLMRREISRIGNLNLNDVRNKDIFDIPGCARKHWKEFPKIELLAKKLHFFDEPPIHIEDIEHDIEGLKPEIVVIDHFNEIQIYNKPKFKDMERINHLVTVLQGFANQGIAVIAVCALNRTGEQRAEYASVGFSALRGSSSLEYGATKIWSLRHAKKSSGHTHILDGLKSKETTQTDIPLNFDGSKMSFTVADPRQKPSQETQKPKKKNTSQPSKQGEVDGDGGVFLE